MDDLGYRYLFILCVYLLMKNTFCVCFFCCCYILSLDNAHITDLFIDWAVCLRNIEDVSSFKFTLDLTAYFYSEFLRAYSQLENATFEFWFEHCCLQKLKFYFKLIVQL